MEPYARTPELVYLVARAKPQRGTQRAGADLAAARGRGRLMTAQTVLRGFVVGLVFWAGALFALSIAG